MTKIFIDGEAGTTGLQIRERLQGRRDLELIQLGDDRRKDAKARADALAEADVAILCLPDDAAREAVSLAAESGTRMIDASTAHRTDPDWTYGFAEMEPGQGQAIAAARYVSNPGCWPQGFIALVRPLVEAGLVSAEAGLSYGGVSGYSGGGKKMIADYEAAGDAAPAYLPYGLTLAHKHLPEMQAYSGLSAAPLFQPAVIPVAQGMLATVPLAGAALADGATPARLHEVLADRYAGAAFVRVAPLGADGGDSKPDPRSLNGTNDMGLQVFANAAGTQVLLMAIYDNLGKGASGAAVQNLNLMLGADAALGLAAA